MNQDLNETNRIYQLRFTDPQTQNVLIIHVNMQLKPVYALQLLSLRYEFNKVKEQVASVPAVNIPVDSIHPIIPIGSIFPYISSPMPTSCFGSPTPTELSFPQVRELTSPAVPQRSRLSSSLVSPIPSYIYPTSSFGPPLRLTSTRLPPQSITPAPSSISMTPRLQPQVPQMCQLYGYNLMSTPIPTTIQPSPTGERKDAFDDLPHLHSFACSGSGSHYIVNQISNPIFFKIFFEKLTPCFPALMTNKIGHTVCRSLYSQTHCKLEHKVTFLESLFPSFSEIASSRQGSFALICIMTLMTTDEEIKTMAKAFDSVIRTEEDESNAGFEEIILSQSGYHVIKKFIGFGAPHIECILNGMSWNFVKFSSHHYGVPIIRSLLDTIGTAVGDNSISDLYYLQLFADHTPSLVTNQYGNYVVQQLFDISPQSVTDIVKQSMRRHFSEFAQHKFASNVVERCLQHTLKEQKEREQEQGRIDWIAVIIHELLEDAETLINHKF